METYLGELFCWAVFLSGLNVIYAIFMQFIILTEGHVFVAKSGPVFSKKPFIRLSVGPVLVVKGLNFQK